MVVNGKENEDPVGILKRKAAMPTQANLIESLQGLKEKEETEKLPRCPCPYWLKDKTIFVYEHLTEMEKKS